MKKNNKLDVWMISQISVFLNHSIDTVQGNSVYWLLDDNSQLEINFDDKEVKFIDWVGDDKTYFAILGLCKSRNMEPMDYFTDYK
jgi:hypothetical protein